MGRNAVSMEHENTKEKKNNKHNESLRVPEKAVQPNIGPV